MSSYLEMDRENGSSECSSWTVIVHQNLRDSPIGRLLKQKVAKVRSSESLIEGVVVFPASKTAYLIIELTTALVTDITSAANRVGSSCSTFDRIDALIRVHARCYVILMADLFTSVEFQAVSALQYRYLTSDMDFLLAHNSEECVTAMLMVSMPQTPPMCYKAHQNFCELMTQMVQDTIPVPQHGVNH